MSLVVESLMTAEQFGLLPDNGKLCELVKGRIVEMNMPKPPHGLFCGNIYWELRSFIAPRALGRAFVNDTGIITERDPDSVRGPDVFYVNYSRWPKGSLPNEYPTVAPELVFEVRSPSDRMHVVIDKILEYLRAGVLVGCILDPQTRTLTVYRPDSPPEVLTEELELTLADLFGPEFRVPVSRFFAE